MDVMPDVIRHPWFTANASSGVKWIAGRARNDTMGDQIGMARLN